MNTVAPKISVVICAYTEARWDDLVRAVDSAQRQTLPPFQIIVVIDHNPVLLKRARAQWPALVVVENHQPRGLSGARNSGIAAAHGDIVAFLDDDAIATADWLAELAASYDSAHVIGVGGAIVPLWQGGRPRWFPEEFDWVVGCTYQGMPMALTPVRNMIGCNMSAQRTVLMQLGGFRIGRVGALSVGQEDDETELCIRAGKAFPTARILFQPTARVQHQVPPHRARWPYFVKRCFSEGVSKAHLAKLVGAERGLASERAYTFRALPLGLLRAFAHLLLHLDVGALGRAFAIIMGLIITVVGYVYGAWARGGRVL